MDEGLQEVRGPRHSAKEHMLGGPAEGTAKEHIVATLATFR